MVSAMGDDSRLHLDPALRAPLRDGALPPVPDYQLTPTSLLGDEGAPGHGHPSVMPGHLRPPGQGDAGAPSLDPRRMLSVYGHYADEDPGEALSRHIMTPLPARGAGGPAQAPGLTVGGFRVTGRPVTSTDDRFDTPGTRARAEQQERDQGEAQRRGETAPDPVGEQLRGR